jgi:hypothetical protein
MKRLLFVLGFLIFLIPFRVSTALLQEGFEMESPWFQRFTPTNEYYVSAKGHGSGKSKSDPTSLNAAIQGSKAGDLFWLLPDTYTGTFVLSNPGTSFNPIVYRAMPGPPVVLIGSIDIKGAYNWVWGLEFTDPKGTSQDPAITLSGAGIRLINNVIHHKLGNSGINSFNLGSGQVIYGNIVYWNGTPHAEGGAHNLYVQNDFNKFGRKYIVNNMFLDASDVCDACYNVHAYAQQGPLSGLYFEKNIIKDGRFLIGGFGDPVQQTVVKENYFFKSGVQLGYRRPVQADFEDNYLGRSELDIRYFWGAGETKYPQASANIFRHNQILFPNGPHMQFMTSAFLSSGRCEGCPSIRRDDIFDENQYSAPFQASFFANNQNLGGVNFEEWKKAAAEAGNAFDARSSLISSPLQNKVVTIANSYEPSRTYIVIYNWEKRTNVILDVSGFVPARASYKIYDAEKPFSSPLISDVSPKVPIPMSDQEFKLLVLIR